MIPEKNNSKSRDISDFILNIKKEDATFNEDDLNSHTENVINILYNTLKDTQSNINLEKCKNEVIEKMLNNKQKYRITKDIDRISIQYVGLYDGIEENNKKYIKVKLSIFFYDNTRNNDLEDKLNKEEYWNDIWIVTYQNIDSKNRKNSNCENCGASMEYNRLKKMFECEYCGNIKLYLKDDINWEIIDIEVQ